MKKISIVIPIYNAERYLTQTIECLKRQTLKEIEIILVNDGSTDNSLNICEELTKGDERFIIISQENKGVSATRNIGKKKANGEYLLFIDADDIFDEDMCESMYNTAIENSADLVIYGIKIQEFNGKVRYMNNSQIQEEWDLNKALMEFFYRKRLNIGVHTKLFSKKITERIQFEEGKKINEDKYFLFEGILLAEKIVYKDSCKYQYIRRLGSASNSAYHPKYKDAIYFSKKILDICEREHHDFYISAYEDLANALLFTFRKLCKKKENKEKYNDDYIELKTEIKRCDLTKLRKYKLINRLEILFIKCFDNLYYYIIKAIYKNK